MKIVVFGLTISSSWGNGHATLWRGLCKGLARLGHRVVFFEHDQPWYANSRDWRTMPAGELVLYDSWQSIAIRADQELADADAAIVTSYCPDALHAQSAVLDANRPLAVFYDLDTPVTLSRLQNGERVPYIGDDRLRDFDLVLSYTGGAALDELRSSLGARCVGPLYGHVDPEVHRPIAAQPHYEADLSWLGTYAADRHPVLEELFVRPATHRPQQRFLIGGAQYPDDFPWTSNIYFVRHVPPDDHAAFFCSSRLTLNVTRDAMARMGWCPSGRLFEAAACGAVLLTDAWPGLGEFYTPGSEILTARTADDTLAALDMDHGELRRIARAARQRTLDEHTCHHRARLLVRLLEETRSSSAVASQSAVANPRDNLSAWRN
ncbi:MAG: CgeB family protein [Steroidobacter sp.]